MGRTFFSQAPLLTSDLEFGLRVYRIKGWLGPSSANSDDDYPQTNMEPEKGAFRRLLCPF